MMDPAVVKQVIVEQNRISRPQHFFSRSLYKKVQEHQHTQDIIVISGVRRCGKSTLLQEIRAKSKESNFFINFEDDRLIKFDVSDFQMLFEIFIELYGIQKVFYFDEIQSIPGWELFVRRLHNQGYKVYITGSNATLFSSELGTKLTGRYVQLEMYPYSFSEYASHYYPDFKDKKVLTTEQVGQLLNLFGKFREWGGIPEYVEFHKSEYLHHLYESILYKDVISRFNLTHDRPIKEQVHYLASNIGKEFSYNSLRKLLGFASATTVSDYCHYLEKCYLLFIVNRYSHSLKKQLISKKKCYFIDPVLAKYVGFRPTEDFGRLMENIVFLELKGRGKEVYFHQDQKECDFLVRANGKIEQAIQVCTSLNSPLTKEREIAGLMDAMETYSLKQGIILTENQTEALIIGGQAINVMPIWKWLILDQYSGS